ncbi:MAG TPA: methyltransferase [Rhodanobacteraceae bacterium]|nr:methyltransferase [Rhodanobacteraceae bacterium]
MPPDAATTAAPTAPADQPAEDVPPESAAALQGLTLDQVLAGDWRAADNKTRDRYRHPKATLEFFGLTPDMSLVEITPGGGWYAEILAPYLNASGHYVAAIARPSKPEGEAARDSTALHALFAGDTAHYGNARIVEFDPKAPNFGPAGSADRVVTFRNVHNWVGAGTAPAMFKAFFDVLKPGGVLGVTDHRAAAGKTVEQLKGTGYLPQDYVVELATDAGFRLADQSEINANPKDTKDYEKGVWTLPPSLRLGDKDQAKYLAIGESDRMTLKFVKPQGDEIFHQGGDHGEAAKPDSQ